MKKEALENLYMQAQNLLIKGKAKKAFKLFKRCAYSGHKDCIFMLGVLYDTGEGVEVNKQKAKSLYKIGAKNNDEAAMTNLAIIYREEYKYKKMLKWFKKALKHNDGDAALEIARYYLQKAKINKANKYLKIAVNHTSITEYDKNKATLYLKRLYKKIVYTVQHCYQLDGCDEIKDIGIFSTKKKAKDAINKLKKQKGFKKYKKGFTYGPQLINQIYWDGGFFTYLPKKSKS